MGCNLFILDSSENPLVSISCSNIFPTCAFSFIFYTCPFHANVHRVACAPGYSVDTTVSNNIHSMSALTTLGSTVSIYSL
uniref:Uncharacterized protein n=1 Tax=Arundo donax TaxID=35708 RepID=A0A0A9FP67_ARUDO